MFLLFLILFMKNTKVVLTFVFYRTIFYKFWKFKILIWDHQTHLFSIYVHCVISIPETPE